VGGLIILELITLVRGGGRSSGWWCCTAAVIKSLQILMLAMLLVHPIVLRKDMDVPIPITLSTHWAMVKYGWLGIILNCCGFVF
jgi:hypothetical protein